MSKFNSTERVERDGYLVYAKGDAIPDTDVAELERQGHIKQKVARAPAPEPEPAKKVAAKKSAAKKD